MKKALWFLIISVLVIVPLCGCGDNAHYGLSEGTYTASVSEEVPFPPRVTFNLSDDTFTFSYDALSSYLAYGTFEISDGRIIAKTDDGKYTYLFRIRDNDTIVFVAEGSSEIVMIQGEPSVVDGTEFRFSEDNLT